MIRLEDQVISNPFRKSAGRNRTTSSSLVNLYYTSDIEVGTCVLHLSSLNRAHCTDSISHAKHVSKFSAIAQCYVGAQAESVNWRLKK